MNPGTRESSSPQVHIPPQTPSRNAQSPAPTSFGDQEELFARIRKLEAAVFDKAAHASRDNSQDVTDSAAGVLVAQKTAYQEPSQSNCKPPKTPFRGSFPLPSPTVKQLTSDSSDTGDLLRYMPPKVTAIELSKHFCHSVHLTFGVFYNPSTQNLLDQTYQKLLQGEQPDRSTLLLLFCIFAGASLVATPQFLQRIGATREECRTAFETYSRLALSIVENTTQSIPPSTVAFQGIISLLHLVANADGFTDKANMIRMRAITMARTMQVHRLDTPRSCEQRRLQGHNAVEVEIQRRVWWHMVATDWLLGFTGGPQDGTYMLHPEHMKVNYPKNIDDEFIAAVGEDYDFPLTVPTSMTAFIYRIKLADLCRQVVDQIPLMLLDPQDIDYETVLSLDARFQVFLKDLPVFFKLDPASIQQSQGICRERPFIPWQRIVLHFGINTRICRLHRPFHCASPTNPKFAFSRTSSIRAAQTVLQLCRSMDDIGEIGGKPSRLWMLMQHVFLAAITLATDVSLDPTAPYASVHKAEVLAACRMLERSQQESAIAKEVIQKGVHTLMSMIQKQCPLISSTQHIGFPQPHESYPGSTELPALDHLPIDRSKAFKAAGTDEVFTAPIPTNGVQTISNDQLITRNDVTADTNLLADFGEQDWGHLWSEFFNAAPDWGTSEWNSLMEGIDLNLGPTLS
ncbi:Fc.00g079810.m01.CDS01 [Cosmosporella sp. VM-42]